MSVLEHATVYLTITNNNFGFKSKKYKYLNNIYSKVVHTIYGYTVDGEDAFEEMLITTNLRVLVENDWLDDLRFIADDITKHKKRYTFSLLLILAFLVNLIDIVVIVFQKRVQDSVITLKISLVMVLLLSFLNGLI